MRWKTLLGIWLVICALSAFTLFLLIGRCGANEHPATLYAINGQALYRVNPNNGVFHKILDFTGFPILSYNQLAYHPRLHKLYGFLTKAESGTQFCSIDPVSAAVSTIASYDQSAWAGHFLTNYDYQTGQLLLCYSDSSSYPTGIASLDPTTGAVTPLVRPTIGAPYAMAIDFHGNLWLEEMPDTGDVQAIYFEEWSLFNPPQFVKRTELNPIHGPWIHYHSLSFQPYTGALFASGTFYGTNFAEIPHAEYNFLCTVDLKTGKPAKIVATYPTDTKFKITWAP